MELLHLIHTGTQLSYNVFIKHLCSLIESLPLYVLILTYRTDYYHNGIWIHRLRRNHSETQGSKGVSCRSSLLFLILMLLSGCLVYYKQSYIISNITPWFYTWPQPPKRSCNEVIATGKLHRVNVPVPVAEISKLVPPPGHTHIIKTIMANPDLTIDRFISVDTNFL